VAATVKEIIARGTIAAYLTLRYHKEMKENYRKGDWLEAVKDTAFFAVAMTPVVAPGFFFGTLGPVWIGLGAGVIATGFIVEVTGIGEWEEVRDFVLQDPRKMPRDYYETVAPKVKGEIKEAYYATLGVAGLMNRMVRAKAEKALEYGQWLNPTPGYRLF